MKYLFHLISGQSTPNYIAAKEIQPDSNVFLFSSASVQEKNGLVKMLSGSHHEMEIDPFAFSATAAKVKEFLDQRLKPGDDAILNFTAGTKPASTALYGLFQSLDKTRLYIDTENRRLIELSGNGESQRPLTIDLPIEVFFELNRQKITIKNPDESEVQNRLMIFLENHFAKYKKQILDDAYNFNEKSSNFKGQIAKYKNGVSTVKFGDAEDLIFQEEGKGLLKWLFGLWFEKVCFLELKKTGLFPSLERNVVMEFKKPKNVPKANFKRKDKNELDIFGVRGVVPYLFECKSGKVKASDLEQLDALKNRYVGKYCVPIIISYKSVGETAIIEKAGDYGISLLTLRELYKIKDIVDKPHARIR